MRLLVKTEQYPKGKGKHWETHTQRGQLTQIGREETEDSGSALIVIWTEIQPLYS